ncbi:MAG: methyltransferase [Bacteroidota bacterium]
MSGSRVFRALLKRALFPVLYPLAKRYFSQHRPFRYRGLKFTVHANVFHPGPTISTKILLDFLAKKAWPEVRVLELGAGSGVISVYLALQGARVTASDVNPAALQNVEANATKHAVPVATVLSDLFTALSENAFDRIIVNPPYYPKDPTSDAEKAWYCGAEFEYFHRFFQDLHQQAGAEVLMILSEDCAIDTIREMARSYGWTMETVHQKQVWLEWNYIFLIAPEASGAAG